MKTEKYRNLWKNGFLFIDLMINRKSFGEYIFGLIEKYKSPYQKEPLGFFYNYKSYEAVKSRNKVAYSQKLSFLKKIGKEKQKELLQDINGFLTNNDLGDEWLITVTDFIISGWFSPPIFNFSMKEIKAGKRERISLVLNPDTSLDDIEEGFQWIKKRQKEIWPHFKRPNFTKKSFRNLFIYLEDLEERMKKEKGFDEANKKKYEITDLDLAGRIYANEKDDSAEADKKRSGNLRQIRRRFRKKRM